MNKRKRIKQIEGLMISYATEHLRLCVELKDLSDEMGAWIKKMEKKYGVTAE